MYPENSIKAAAIAKQNFNRGMVEGADQINSVREGDVRANEIPEKVGNLFYQVEELSSVAQHLVNRLETVLRPEAPMNACEATAGRPNHTPFGSQLDQLKDRMVQINYVLSSALDRLEL